MNAKELANGLLTRSIDFEKRGELALSGLAYGVAKSVATLVPKYRPPQPSDDGKWCFLEELPSDAPPTLVVLRDVAGVDDQGHYRRDEWHYWTVAGWRELTKGVWPCERPEGGGT